MRRIIWTDEAVSNLEAIVAYVGAFSPAAAERLATELSQTAERLALHPDRGRPIRAGMREIVVIRPYLIRYRVHDEAVAILRIRHGYRRQD